MALHYNRLGRCPDNPAVMSITSILIVRQRTSVRRMADRGTNLHLLTEWIVFDRWFSLLRHFSGLTYQIQPIMVESVLECKLIYRVAEPQ